MFTVNYNWHFLKKLTRVGCVAFIHLGQTEIYGDEIAGVPETTRPISAASRPKFTVLWDIWRRYCCLTSYFPIDVTFLSCKDIARQSCTMVRRWRLFCDFLRPAFSASRVQHVSDLHPKFALRPHHVWQTWQTSNLRLLRLGEEKKNEEERRNHRAKL